MNELKCVVCGGSKYELLFAKRLENISNAIKILKCCRCKMVFLGPGAPYFDETYGYYGKRASLSKEELFDKLNDNAYKKILESFRKIDKKAKKLLDVGCGQGQFVDYALRQGWDAMGLEVSDSAVNLCKKLDIPVNKADLSKADVTGGPFDAITLFEVIEHVDKPSMFLRKVVNQLKPGGLLFLTTPNFDSLDRRLLGQSWHVIHPEHKNYFTSSTIKKIIYLSSGLRVRSVVTKNMSIHALAGIFSKRKDTCVPEKIYYNKNNCYVNQEQRLRENIEKSLLLKAVKEATNTLLNIFNFGSNLAVLCQKEQ